MKRITSLVVILLAAPACLLAQTSSSTVAPSQNFAGGSSAVLSGSPKAGPPAPFSRLAFGAGIGLGGINMQAAVEANRYLNIRGIGNYFSYTVSNVKIDSSNGSSGVNVSGNLNFAEAGVALDFYPFPNHGFRLSPGAAFYNQNQVTASGVASSGSSVTLGSVKYYSDSANPMSVNATLGLNTHKQAFSMTTGWGNMISRKGGHFSFPFEIGAIFTGVPTLGFNVTGYGCTVQSDASSNGPSCVNMATNASAQTNVNAQIAKYQNDLNPLKVYPIFSFGLAFNFSIR